MNEFYKQAFAKGKQVARDLMRKVPRPRLGKRKPPEKPPALPAPSNRLLCPECGLESAGDARFCQYCGHPFETNLEAGQ